MEKSVVYMSDCVFANNVGGSAGAIQAAGGSANISNCSFEGNSSPFNTGVYLNAGGIATFENCRFAGNSGNQGEVVHF